MERVLALGQDMALLWTRYAPLYLSGVVNTLLLAVAATVLGCLIAWPAACSTPSPSTHRTACPGESCCGCSGP